MRIIIMNWYYIYYIYCIGRNSEWDKLELQWMGNEEERASFGINFQSNWNCFLCPSLSLHLRRHYFCWKVYLHLDAFNFKLSFSSHLCI